MAFEYKVVGAPEKGRRQRGARTRTDRVAAAFEEVLQTHAVDGWDYLRTDLVPVEERHGLFGKREEIHRAVMVFRREVAPAAEPSLPAPRSRHRGEQPDEPLVLAPEARQPRRHTRPEPEIRLAHSSDGTDLKKDMSD